MPGASRYEMQPSNNLAYTHSTEDELARLHPYESPISQSEMRYDSRSTDIENEGSSYLESDRIISSPTPKSYRVYKRRFFVLAEFTLLNLVIGWQGSAFSALTQPLAQYLHVSVSEVNLLSSLTYIAFIVPCPITIWVLNKGGPKRSMIVCAALLLVGTWIYYAGMVVKSYGVIVAGNMITAAAQPFVLCAPTKNSQLWFSPKTRTLATALPSLAYPLGAGVATLLGPVIYEGVGILGLTLIISVTATAGCLAAPFIPRAPPSPPSRAADTAAMPLLQALKQLSRKPPFYLQFISFSIFAGSFLTTAALIVNILAPYGFGIHGISVAGALMVFVGLAASFIVSPLLDRFGGHLITAKIFVPLLAATYTGIIFVGRSHSPAAVYILFSLIGVFSISMEPCVLQFQAAWTHPVPPEIASTFCWMGAQICGAVFTVVISYGINRKETQPEVPTVPITGGLIFQSVLVWMTVPLTLMTGVGPFKRPLDSEVHDD